MEWMTANEMAVPDGRGPKLGDGDERTEVSQPWSHRLTPDNVASFAVMVGIESFANGHPFRANVDAQSGHAVAHLAQ